MKPARARVVTGLTRKRLLFSPLLVIELLFAGSAAAQLPAGKIIVAVAPCPPIVIREDDKLTGLGMFLWEAVAREMGAEYELVETSLSNMLDAIAREKSTRSADIGVSCLSVTAERERVIDFSHSFYETYTGIAVREQGIMSIIAGLVKNPAVWRALAIVLGLAVLIGGIFFALERRTAPKLYSMTGRFSRPMEALMVGLLFVTQGPVKFYEFRGLTARVLAAVLALSSTFLIAGVTAVLASAFTVESLQSQVDSLSDLAKVRVAALESSTSSGFLRANGIAHQTRADLDDMMQALQAGQLDAVVADAAFLKYTIMKGREKGDYASLSVLPYEFDSQNYGFAMQHASELKEAVNQALLVVRKTPQWRQIVLEYLGE